MFEKEIWDCDDLQQPLAPNGSEKIAQEVVSCSDGEINWIGNGRNCEKAGDVGNEGGQRWCRMKSLYCSSRGEELKVVGA